MKFVIKKKKKKKKKVHSIHNEASEIEGVWKVSNKVL